eukprot:351934-Chlamydomonas_euryale.AAC.4
MQRVGTAVSERPPRGAVVQSTSECSTSRFASKSNHHGMWPAGMLAQAQASQLPLTRRLQQLADLDQQKKHIQSKKRLRSIQAGGTRSSSLAASYNTVLCPVEFKSGLPGI